jgi:hypothetical protein
VSPIFAMIASAMRFAQIVFIGAGVWGIVVLTPLSCLVDAAGLLDYSCRHCYAL